MTRVSHACSLLGLSFPDNPFFQVRLAAHVSDGWKSRIRPVVERKKFGIPTVTDRIVQQAMAQQMIPIYEPIFLENKIRTQDTHDPGQERITEKSA